VHRTGPEGRWGGQVTGVASRQVACSVVKVGAAGSVAELAITSAAAGNRPRVRCKMAGNAAP